MKKPVNPAMRMAFFDLDGTLIEGNSWQGFYLWLMKRKPAWTPGLLLGLTARSLMLMDGIRLRARVLRRMEGLTQVEINALGEEFFREWMRPRLRPVAVEAIQRHREAGDQLLLVTAAFDFLALPVSCAQRFNGCLSTVLFYENGVFTGTTRGTELRAERKRAGILAYVGERRVDWEESHAYGDEATDLPMLSLVGKPVYLGKRPPAAIRALAGLQCVRW